MKAGLIVAIFMRMALIYAILVAPALNLFFVGAMVFQANYTLLTWLVFSATGSRQ
jgi:cytochrome c oxidase subunit 4